PVVAVPENPPHESLRLAGPVVVAYDGGMQAARALQMFALSGLAALGEVYIVTIDPADSVTAARVADRAVQFLSWHEVTARPIASAHSGSAADVVLEQVGMLKAQLIVMGAHNGWQ